ncbi:MULTISPECIES: MurR/RpiR family transcriptional regulator [Nitrincola]|uniref:Putative DNA-binding transcriptional regulator n=1 Tax=Nitrincola nitratireducens TaxID=1229521 RepID=W9UZM0_9GAMM|nr:MULTISPECIES: MurR/RpiR family transcriptional regulator [Nitrincola]EXJ12519.1 putative DNA-binding transcriptional regulator [Nitrincola nitratireducens]
MRQITDVIRKEYEDLSPSERRVASFILDHLDDLATYNSVELSEACQTSKATVSRLFRRLGYDSFKAMRDEVRVLRQSGVPLPSGASESGTTLLDRHFRLESKNLSRLNQQAKLWPLDAILSKFEQARRVVLIGFRNSYPVAMHWRQQLIQVRPDIQLLPQAGQTLAEDLADLTDQDLIILIGFHRRPAQFPMLLNRLKSLAIPVLLITETQSGLDHSQATWCLEIPLDSVSAFDSYALPMSLVSFITNALLHQQLRHGRQRIEEINRLYDSLQELDLTLN